MVFLAPSANNRLLLTKSTFYAIVPFVINWIDSYLRRRSFQVSVNGSLLQVESLKVFIYIFKYFIAPISSGLRGHAFKIYEQRCKTRRHQYAFSILIVPYWDKLPEEIVNAPSVEIFKTHWVHYYCLWSYMLLNSLSTTPYYTLYHVAITLAVCSSSLYSLDQ